MDTRHPGLTKAIAASNLEAACVCLNRHHCPPAPFELVLQGDSSSTDVDWEPPSARALNAWANETDATAAGACAMVLAAVEQAEGLVAMRRAETLTGADYYVALEGTEPHDLEGCLRLEVSGIDHGTKSDVNGRLTAKLEQARRGNSDLPAMAGVVGFKVKTIRLARLLDGQ